MEQQGAFGWKKPIQEEIYFYGRGTETKEILEHLSDNQSVFLVGSKKIGKTSLITHLLREDVQQLQGILPKRHIFVYIDFNDSHYQTPDNFWADVIGELDIILNAQEMREGQPKQQEKKVTPLADEDLEHKGKVEDTEKEKKPARYSNEELTGFIENAAKKHQITIVMDGFECLVKKEAFGSEFYSTLKQLVGQIGNLSYLVSSSKDFSQAYRENDDLQATSLSEIFTTIHLGLLKKREAMAFLKQENSHAIDMDRRVVEWGYEVTGGHPYLLQIIGYHLDSSSIKTNEQLTAHRDEIMGKATDECSGFFMHLLEDLSAEEREGLLALIRFKPVRNMIELLARKSLVRDRKSHKVFSDLFDRFLHEFWGDLAEDKPVRIQVQLRQKVFLAGIATSFFSIFLGTFALLSSALVLGTFLFGLGILCFLIIFMFFNDEGYSLQKMPKL
ncbi:ATP-binding protein [Candidatus Desantisbacteria bacterium]|nr:ATP-binding protein [Candidatus Desantisbacteria bacterium]